MIDPSTVTRFNTASSAQPPAVVGIGLPVYNGARHMRSALDSLLSQSFSDFKLVISDNASTDATFEICKEYAAEDPRILVFRHDQNIGLLENWRFVFQQAGAEYFMWASDHDLWDPKFIEAHLNELANHPDAVMAYPVTVPIDDNSEPIDVTPTIFSSVGLSKYQRAKEVCLRMHGAGNMIYGLFRSDVLDRCGVLPNNAAPDRLLLIEMAAHGAYKQISDGMWFRRYPGGPPVGAFDSLDNLKAYLGRKRGQMYPDGDAPLHSYLPTLAQVLDIVKHLSKRPSDGSNRNVLVGFYMAALHLKKNRRKSWMELRAYFTDRFGSADRKTSSFK